MLNGWIYEILVVLSILDKSHLYLSIYTITTKVVLFMPTCHRLIYVKETTSEFQVVYT